MTKLIKVILVIISSFFILSCPPKREMVSVYVDPSDQLFQSLSNKISLWSNKYAITTPSLQMRFNRSFEGFYHQGKIMILIKKEYPLNINKIHAVLAHEFGHHYIESKFLDKNFSPPEKELLSDLVARELVGEEILIKALSSEEASRDTREFPSISDRILFLKDNPPEKVSFMFKK